MNKAFKTLTTFILCLGTYSFADEALNSEILSTYSANNPNALESHVGLRKVIETYFPDEFDFEVGFPVIILTLDGDKNDIDWVE